jgi:hypothetical protein
MQHAHVLIILVVFSLSANAQTSNNGPIIPGFPASFH